jgi:hypothetical protein
MRQIKLRAFEIENKNIGKISSGLLVDLQEKLKASTTASERRMVLNAEEDKPEEDLISYHITSSQVQFCTMLRIKPGKDVQHINEKLFNKPSFTISELHNTAVDATAIYKEHYYFGVSGDFLVTNLPGNITITRLQTYLNWYLQKLYEISPIISQEASKNLSSVRSITVVDPVNESAIRSLKIDERQRSVFNLPSLALEKVKGMLVDAKSLTDIELANLISAKLVIEFNKPKKSDSEEVKKAYAALLKPISDLDHVQIQTRDRKQHKKGSDILRTKTVDIDLTQNGRINENTLIQAMAFFINELSHEKKSPD